MAIELKQSVKLSQQLLITPQLQQAIRLLQLSRMELVETVQKELMENPVLEEATGEEADESVSHDSDREAAQRILDVETVANNEPADPRADVSDKKDDRELGTDKDFDWASYIASYNATNREPRSFSRGDEELPNYENMLSAATSLQDHLEWQIKMGSLTQKEEEACLTLIGNLDDNGYLKTDLEELANKTPFTLNQLEEALRAVQDLDPPGVGARDLKECLLIQIRDMGAEKPVLAQIIKNHLGLIEKRNYPALAKKLGVTTARAKYLADLIFSLEPKPGRAYSRGEPQYITPDVYIKKVGDEYVVLLNEDGLPKLQISNFYRSAIMKAMTNQKQATREQDNGRAKLNDEARGYIQEKLKSALWLIKSIHQRQKTLYKVTKAIVHFQRQFLEKGVQELKPLVLRDVANHIGVHESTVSRATNGKYVHTPQGIYELKYFFNTGIANAQGDRGFANEAVKQMISQYISSEDARSPLSDQAITRMLKRQNIDIARRTVAKYREMLGILPSSRRKRLS